MHVVITGSTGLVGSALLPSLSAEGHRVTCLVRPSTRRPSRSAVAPGISEAEWDPATGRVDRTALEGADAVVHLAGDGIATGRWTAAKKARIRESRVRGTRVLAEALAGLDRLPEVFACASAIGYYGNRGDEVLREESGPGSGFLAGVCKEWEAASEPAAKRGIRVVNVRIGVVLSSRGGALKKMLPPFRLGLGGVIGDGRQYMSWISLDDLVGAIQQALFSSALRGPMNAVAPAPVTNRELTRTLGRILVRPTVIPMPAFAARLLFGEMADELLLSSTRVEPARLKEIRYQFRHPTLDVALRHVLEKT